MVCTVHLRRSERSPSSFTLAFYSTQSRKRLGLLLSLDNMTAGVAPDRDQNFLGYLLHEGFGIAFVFTANMLAGVECMYVDIGVLLSSKAISTVPINSMARNNVLLRLELYKQRCMWNRVAVLASYLHGVKLQSDYSGTLSRVNITFGTSLSCSSLMQN